MSDIYHIPGDDGKDFRLRKFVEYQHEVPSIHYRFLGEYIRRHKYGEDETVDLCFFMASTYNELTCVLLNELFKTLSAEEIWSRYRDNLLFFSARKYVKLNNQFVDLIEDWKRETNGEPYKWLKEREEETAEGTYRRVQRDIQKIKNVGRFASDLFLEMVVYMKDYLRIRIKEPTKMDWKNCANLTSGIYNLFYEDEKANEFDRTRKVSEAEKEELSKRLQVIQWAIRKTYKDQDSEISMFIGKICSFRNLFKNARYAGFHHDRELEALRKYEAEFPEFREVWEECYRIRADIFQKRFLGEFNGWDGIRKERKKMWLREGKTGAENE